MHALCEVGHEGTCDEDQDCAGGLVCKDEDGSKKCNHTESSCTFVTMEIIVWVLGMHRAPTIQTHTLCCSTNDECDGEVCVGGICTATES